MTYTILTATYAISENDAAIIETEEAGAIAVSERDTHDLWDMLRSHDISPYVQTPVPLTPLTASQFRLWLLANGLLQNVQSTIDTLPEPERTKAQIVWEYATLIERDHPLVTSLSTQLGLTEEQIDAMWEAALAV